MLKLKPLVIGTIVEILLFFLFISMIAFFAKIIGTVSSNSYLLGLEIASCISVLVGAFVCARSAFEKGAIYGMTIAIIWVLFRVIFTFLITNSLSIPAVLFNLIILCGFGFIGGAMGISKKKTKFI